jgi:1-aminocyclopropane-1-carboxylate deaminase/D-cysteine desulfhydrase-like pyridoxal-dependent ACC family enzyme
VRLSGLGAAVHAFAVCDDEDYFYRDVGRLLGENGYGDGGPGAARELLTVHQAKGAGYALSQADELETVCQAALAGGVVLDPVYSGKALHGLLGLIRASPDEWAGKRIVFVHTGGLLGTYDKVDQLQPIVEGWGRHERLSVEGVPVRQ